MGSLKVPSHRELALLSILVSGEKYGREISQEYERVTKEEMPLGSLYVTLDRMEEKGFLKSRLGESCADRGGNRRKYYKISANGKSVFEGARAAALGIFGKGLANG